MSVETLYEFSSQVRVILALIKSNYLCYRTKQEYISGVYIEYNVKLFSRVCKKI